MKVVLAFDSFKGSLSSLEVADAVAQELLEAAPGCEMLKIAIADGGEGTVLALTQTTGGELAEVMVNDPLGRPLRATYGLIDQGRTAVMEMASASGLALLSREERMPLLTSTFGFGQMVADALDRGCRRFLIGIGGSATNDGGTGMLSALGYRFLDSDGQVLDGCGASLERIAVIDDSSIHESLRDSEFIIACDVTNPLCGPDGAAFVYAPQKGADAEMVRLLDRGLANLAECIRAYNGKDVMNMPGAGAAGGLGAAFSAFLDARLERGVDMVLDAVRFDELIAGSALVLTGEGRMDAQTLMGKAPAGVMRRAAAQGIPTVAICGTMEPCPELERSGFRAIIPLYEGEFDLSEALRPESAKAKLAAAARNLFQSLIRQDMYRDSYGYAYEEDAQGPVLGYEDGADEQGHP